MPVHGAVMSELERILAEEGLAAESNKDAPIRPDTRISRGHARSKTLQVRLNNDEFTALEELAAMRGLPVSTLVRSLLLPLLTSTRDEPEETIERMRRELDLLARHLGGSR